MKLKRTLESYRACTAKAVSGGSAAQMMYFVEDAKADIGALAAEVERLTQHEADRGSVVKALERFSSSNIMWSLDGTPLLHDPTGEWVRYKDVAALASEGAAAMPMAGSPVSQSVAVKRDLIEAANALEALILKRHDLVDGARLLIRRAKDLVSALTADAGSPVSEASEPFGYGYVDRLPGRSGRTANRFVTLKDEADNLAENGVDIFPLYRQPTPPASEAPARRLYCHSKVWADLTKRAVAGPDIVLDDSLPIDQVRLYSEDEPEVQAMLARRAGRR